MFRLFCAFTLFLALSNSTLFGQGYPDYSGGLKIELNNEGSNYIRFITWHQVWVRYNQNNSGSILKGRSASSSIDLGLRRSRFLFYAQLDERFLILTHFGINNQSAISGGLNSGADGKKPQLFLHDLWTEYKVIGNFLDLGFGLHYWNGPSRQSSASTLNFLTLDAPVFNWTTIEVTDQFARYLGIYAKGQIGSLDYRLSVNDPFKSGIAPEVNTAGFNPQSRSKVFQGYFSWQFAERESTLLPYKVGSYLGSARVVNFGAGFLHHPNGMWSIKKGSTNDTITHHISNFALDFFLDFPVEGPSAYKAAITVYAVNYFLNFGPNQLRNIGVMNPANGGGSLRGNAVPLIGTGNLAYIQLGYLFASDQASNRWQIYFAFSHGRFEALKNASNSKVPVNILDFGLNYLIAGHHAKISMNTRMRPDFTKIDNLKYRPELTLQTMIYL